MKVLEEFETKATKVWENFYLKFKLLYDILKPFKEAYKDKQYEIIRKKRLQGGLTRNESQLENLLGKLPDNQPKFDLEKEQKKLNEQFITELKKVNYFFCEEYNRRLSPRFNEIKHQIEYAHKIGDFDIYADTFEMALKELYKELNILKDYIELNKLGTKTILSKFKKYTQIYDEASIINLEENIDNYIKKKSSLHEALDKINKIESEIENLFLLYFASKYKMKAVKVLKNYVEQNNFTQSQAFFLGLTLGLIMFCACIIGFIIYNYDIDIDHDPDFKSIFPMFRAFYCICLYWWGLGILVYVWNKFGISYRVIFTFDSHYSTVIQIYQRAAAFTFILLISMLIYLFDRINFTLGFRVPTHFLPLICFGSFLAYMFCPIKSVFNFEGRMYLFDLFTESIGSFLMKPEFKHTWFIGQIGSFVGPIRDMEYTLCYYTYYDAPLSYKKLYCNKSRGIYLFIAFFPNFIRILQALKVMKLNKKKFPQLWIVLKSSLTIIVAFLSFMIPTFPFLWVVWLVISLGSTTYSFLWDIYKDFNLMQKGKNFPLRDIIFYHPTWFFYYLIPVLDFFFRFLWLISLSPEVINSFFRPETFSIITFTCSIIRGVLWSMLKVEVAHINIFKEFKVSNDIDLPFIKKGKGFVINDTNLLEQMGMNREEKMKLEMEKVLVEKNKKPINYETRYIPDIFEKNKPLINNEFREYLEAYENTTNENMNVDQGVRRLTRKV